MSELTILVTGVTGYVGGALVPRLQADGHAVRGFARDASKVTLDIEVFEGDATTGEGLDAAMAGVDVAYFLIHSMEGEDFGETERKTAEAFVAAARQADVRRIVYLGGVVPEEEESGGSEHLASRLAVEEVLLDGVPEGVAFRASMIVGHGSRSFDLLAALVERLPVLALPAWRSNKTNPIDERDVLEYLALGATTPSGPGPHVFDIAGSTTLSYGEMVTRIAELAGTPRPAVGLPVNLPSIAGRAGALIADEDVGLVEPLMRSLEYTLVADDEPARRSFGLRPRSFDESVRWALDERARDAEEEAVEPAA